MLRERGAETRVARRKSYATGHKLLSVRQLRQKQHHAGFARSASPAGIFLRKSDFVVQNRLLRGITLRKP
jgi:hypothetical protein